MESIRYAKQSQSVASELCLSLRRPTALPFDAPHKPAAQLCIDRCITAREAVSGPRQRRIAVEPNCLQAIFDSSFLIQYLVLNIATFSLQHPHYEALYLRRRLVKTVPNNLPKDRQPTTQNILARHYRNHIARRSRIRFSATSCQPGTAFMLPSMFAIQRE